MKFRPLHDFVLFRPFQRKDSEIIIVINSKRSYRGEVVAVGKGRDLGKQVSRDPNGKLTEFHKNRKIRPLDVKIGDIINVGETPLKFPVYIEEGIKYWIIQEGDIGFVEEI